MSQKDKKPLISDNMKEKLQKNYSLPLWALLLGVLLLATTVIASISMQVQLSSIQEDIFDDKQQAYYEDAAKVTSQGLDATWDWFAKNSLVFIYRYLGLILGALWIVLLIHGFKVIGR